VHDISALPLPPPNEACPSLWPLQTALTNSNPIVKFTKFIRVIDYGYSIDKGVGILVQSTSPAESYTSPPHLLKLEAGQVAHVHGLKHIHGILVNLKGRNGSQGKGLVPWDK
jgi:hypothetical protein